MQAILGWDPAPDVAPPCHSTGAPMRHPVAALSLKLVAPILLGLVPVSGLWGQVPDGSLTPPQTAEPPPDTYSDAGVRSLVELAREARTEIAEGLASYQGRMWERSYFGISGSGFRRERGIYTEERLSTIRWSADGDHVVRWEGARRDIPIAGASSQRSDNLAGALARDLAGDRSEAQEPVVPPPLAYDPGSDRIAFGGEWALNPLADSAALHYRFRSGDTLTIQLPGQDRSIVLAEVQVEPRRSEFRLLSASLWFDVETGHLVRAGYRPSRPFDFVVDAADDADLPPGFLRPMRAEIRYVTIDHGLYDLRWWIPRRFTFEGEVQIAAFVRFPIALEWSVDDIRVNEPGTLIPEVIPEGWRVREATIGEEGDERVVTVLVPTVEELRNSPELMYGRRVARGIFSEGELRNLRRTLDRIGSAGSAFSGVRLAWGSQDRLTRYNRVEGLSTGVAAAIAVTPRVDVRGEVRYGFADREFGGEVRLRRGAVDRREEIAVFRRLASSTEWATPESLGSSLASALWGGDYAPFHRSVGAEAVIRRESRLLSQELRLFAERHESAVRGTHAHLSRLWTDRDMRENPEATEGSWGGAALRLRWEGGADPSRPRAFGSIRGEAATGSSDYGRAWVSAGVAVPLLPRVAVAVEGGGGGTVGELPAQRHFFPGGPSVFRASPAGDFSGEAFWFARGELGSGLPLLRTVAFVEALGVGSGKTFRSVEPVVAVGGGLSLLDGLFRLDVARVVQGGSGWHILAYTDGLF